MPVEQFTSPRGESLIKVVTKHGKYNWVNYYENIDAALKGYKESRSYLNFMVMLSAGISIGTIVTSLTMLLKDPNVGPLQIAGIISPIGPGMIGIASFFDSRSKLNSVKSTIPEIENFKNS